MPSAAKSGSEEAGLPEKHLQPVRDLIDAENGNDGTLYNTHAG
jgi:hypothetical protein